MSNLSICVKAIGVGASRKMWFDLESHDTSGIHKVLMDGNFVLREMEVIDCTGFFNYMPYTPDEACDLYQEYQRLDNPELWNLFLEWYQDPSIKVLKSVRNFEAMFRGLWFEPEDYLQARAIKNGEIDSDFEGMEFMNWIGYMGMLLSKGELYFIADPDTNKTGVFDLCVFDTSDKASSGDYSREVV